MTKRESLRLLTTIYLSLFSSQLIYLNVCSFYPVYTMKKYKTFTKFDIGAILSLFQISQIAFSLICGNIASKYGRKNMILIA